jgi:hypothetical protein
MGTMRRLTLLVVLLAPLLAVAGCSSSDPSTIEGPIPGASGPGLPTDLTSSLPNPPASTGQTIEVTYAKGAVSPRGYTAKVKLGAKVHLVVHADVSDEVHVHGYDLHAEVTGGTATLDFTADVPGLFEVELESKGYTLLHLQVS